MIGSKKPLSIGAVRTGWEWDVLATYNSECARGIVHTAEYDARMAVEQERFNERQEIAWRLAGGYPVGDGAWVIPDNGD